MNRMLLRVCATGGAALCSLVVFVGTAQAATGVSKDGFTLNVNAGAAGNVITISKSGTDFRVHDEGDFVTAGAGCRSDGPRDALCSMSGIDQIIVRAGAGNDIVSNGVPTLTSILGEAGDDELTGGPGTDVIDGGAGMDIFNGGSGFDTASYRGRTADIRVSLDGSANDGVGGEQDNVKSDVEAILSGSGNDVLIGSDDANRLVGGEGNDRLDGDGGNDVLVGGNGNDTAVGGNGDDRADYGAAQDGQDVFNGGADTDTASYAQRTQGVNVTLHDGMANDGGTGEGDNNFANVENATGGAAGDTLRGNGLANRLDGQEGNDTITGMAGADLLIGNVGNDTIDGVDGQPIDFLNGGAGTDVCRFDVGDRLSGCNP